VDEDEWSLGVGDWVVDLTQAPSELCCGPSPIGEEAASTFNKHSFEHGLDTRPNDHNGTWTKNNYADILL